MRQSREMSLSWWSAKTGSRFGDLQLFRHGRKFSLRDKPLTRSASFQHHATPTKDAGLPAPPNARSAFAISPEKSPKPIVYPIELNGTQHSAGTQHHQFPHTTCKDDHSARYDAGPYYVLRILHSDILSPGPPERILIYNGGTGKTMFLATVRLTSLFLFGISCVYVAPFYENPDAPWYTIPASKSPWPFFRPDPTLTAPLLIVVLGGALPMIFIAYNAAPYVNFVHLALPAFARRSREQTIQYAKSLPPDAILHINTMRITTMPRHTTVRLGDLVPDKLMFRPISFRNTKPKPVPWYRGGVLKEFYTDPESKPGRHSSIFYPELWKHVYRQIQSNRPTHRK